MTRSVFIFKVIALMLGTLGPLLVAEMVLRFLPVNTGLAAMPVNEDHPIFHFTPNRPYEWSKNWNFSIVNHGRTNNAGYVNDQDYQSGGSPMLGIIGDSFIEALMVSYPDTITGRLERTVGARGRVYSFAASGAPLSQYLVWAAQAVREYGAQGIIINVVGNDFDESLSWYKIGPGFHHYVRTADGGLELRRYDYQPSPLRRLAVHSALVRYMLLNCNGGNFMTGLIQLEHWLFPPAQAEEWEGNTTVAASKQRLTDSRDAVDAFFRDLPVMTGLPPNRVTFLIDGLRRHLDLDAEDSRIASSYFAQMRAYFLNQARARGYEAIDLHPFFAQAHRRDGTQMEFPEDSHWNANGHAIAAQAVRQSRLFAEVFDGASGLPDVSPSR